SFVTNSPQRTRMGIMAYPSLVKFASVLALLAAPALMTSPALAQKPVVPAPDPALPGHLKELKNLVKDKEMAGDFQAIGLMQNLSKDLDKKNPKDLEKIAKALGDVFTTGK